MVLNEQGIAEHERQIDVINAIPSNKMDDDPMKNYSAADMEEFNLKHLRDLREQVHGYDEQELQAVAEEIVEIGWTYAYNALGEYFQKLKNQREATKIINNA